MQLDALFTVAVVRTVFPALAHGIARQIAAGANAVCVDEAAAGYTDNAIVVFDKILKVLAVSADVTGKTAAQQGGILCYRQYALVT